MMNTIYWFRNLFFELFQSSLRQNKFNLQCFHCTRTWNLFQCWVKNFWNRVLFTKQSDTTLNILWKAAVVDFLATFERHPTGFHSPPNRNRFHHLQCFKSQSTWPFFKHCTIVFSWLLCLGIYCSIWPAMLNFLSLSNLCFFLYLQYVFIFPLKFHYCISIKYRLREFINILSSIVHGFFNYISSSNVTVLASLRFTEFPHHALMITVPNDYKTV